MKEVEVEVLNLPLLPVEWAKGPIKLMAMTTEGGTLQPKTNVTSEHTGLMNATSENGSITLTKHDANVAMNEMAKSMNNGENYRLSVETKTGDMEFTFVTWDKFKELGGEILNGVIILNKEQPTTYTVTPKVAYKAFKSLAQAGNKISSGEDPLESLVPFFHSYGIPIDRDKDVHTPDTPISTSLQTKPLYPGTTFSDAKSMAELAHVCLTLWGHIQQKQYSAIADLSVIQEHEKKSYVSFLGKLNPLQISYSPQKEDSIWRVHAKNWLYSVVVQQIASMHVETIPTENNGFTIGIKPGGLQSAMWLEFTSRVYGADNPHEGMRQCKQGGKFHGCGEWYRPDGPEDRSNYCPTCRPKAGAERIARLRAKQSQRSAK